jgi:hypothetical protein
MSKLQKLPPPHQGRRERLTFERYIQKYDLKRSTYFDRQRFVVDLLLDLRIMLKEYLKNNILSVTSFDRIVNELYKTFYMVFNGKNHNMVKISRFWGYFYASYIVTLRMAYIPMWRNNFPSYDPELLTFLPISQFKEALEDSIKPCLFIFKKNKDRLLALHDRAVQSSLHILGMIDINIEEYLLDEKYSNLMHMMVFPYTEESEGFSHIKEAYNILKNIYVSKRASQEEFLRKMEGEMRDAKEKENDTKDE